MVTTGARAKALEHLLVRLGYKPVRSRPGPRAGDLSPERLEDLSQLYLTLGGVNPSPQFRPGAWDLAFEGDLVVELDEELHFNRYRRSTLEPAWTTELPWRQAYLEFTVEHEAGCLAAGRWGKRWTNPSCEALFGPADSPGLFVAGGSPRWKQRALYDAMKDAVATDDSNIRLARIATLDLVGGVQVGAVLEGRSEIDLNARDQLLKERSI